MSSSSSHWPPLYLAVAFTTLATLLLELSLTRIFSVVFYYHFAFLAISIALFGLGLGGVFSYVISGAGGNVFRLLGRLSQWNALAVVVAIGVIFAQGLELSNWSLALIYTTTALPFLLAGAVISLAISETLERVNRVYLADLLGAAAGCLLLVPLLNWLGGPNTVIVAAMLFATSGAIWHSIAGNPRGRILSVSLALALVALIFVNNRYHWLDVRYAKGQKLENEIFVKWNSFSRIALAPERGSGMPSIFIDADASTGIANFDFNNLSERNKKDLLDQGPGFPYAVRPGAKTLIIGPGGGWDVSRSLAAGSRDITGVEINPIIARTIMQEKFPQLSGSLYARPDVRIVVEDGRSFVRRSTEKYQVLQATLVDTWASTAAGAFALSENNLYTTDAFRDYLSHLTDDGILAFTRWGFEPPRESLRLLSLAMVALGELGETQPAGHVMVVREGSRQELAGWGARDTVLISRKPFASADIERARAAIARASMEAVYLPGTAARNPFQELLTTGDPAAYQNAYPFDISPVTDDRPFFFYSVQPRDLWNFVMQASRLSADYKINRAVPLLFGLVFTALAATAIILLMPPLVLGTRLPKSKPALAFLPYFICIGAGYILVEVALIQKFVLFLGHPTYALTVVVFSMLAASGFGSFASSRMIGDSDNRLSLLLGGVGVAVGVLAVTVTAVLPSQISAPFWLKVVVAVAAIGPAAFLMGMPFPTGLKRLDLLHAPSVRWAWSLNAASSVLGSSASIVLAIYLGLQKTLLLGGLLYVTAVLAVHFSPRPKHSRA